MCGIWGDEGGRGLEKRYRACHFRVRASARCFNSVGQGGLRLRTRYKLSLILPRKHPRDPRRRCTRPVRAPGRRVPNEGAVGVRLGVGLVEAELVLREAVLEEICAEEFEGVLKARAVKVDVVIVCKFLSLWGGAGGGWFGIRLEVCGWGRGRGRVRGCFSWR